MSHLTSDRQYDRRGIVAEAHRQYAVMTRHGWSFRHGLGFSWSKAISAHARRRNRNYAARRRVISAKAARPSSVNAYGALGS
jgi:transposase